VSILPFLTLFVNLCKSTFARKEVKKRMNMPDYKCGGDWDNGADYGDGGDSSPDYDDSTATEQENLPEDYE
jgi:hypothetical protein